MKKKIFFNTHHLKEGDLFNIVTENNQYIATAYVGRQHKGLGWVITYSQEEDINITFFENLFKKR